MNIREQFAYEVAEEIGAKVRKDKCPKCKAPFLETPSQGFSFCWECTTNHRTAQEGQALLLRCLFKENGVTITSESAWRAVA